MRYYIENEQLKAEIDSLGAELISIVDKDTRQEYMWEADPVFWGKTSPILFPFIGKLEGGGYHYQGQRFYAKKHGFARDMEFAVAECMTDSIVFYIESNAKTLEIYPFSFRLEVRYSLKERSVTESLRVYNYGKETMYFSIGGHPAFACPLKAGNKGTEQRRTDCFIKLYQAAEADQNEGSCVRHKSTETLKPYKGDTVEIMEIGVPDGFVTGVSLAIPVKNALIPITKNLFDQDALCMEKQGIAAVGLCDAQGQEYVRLEADCPVWGIWSVPDSAGSYVCLEPWWGLCDSRGYEGSLEARPYTNSLRAGDSWEQSYRIVLHG